MKISLLLLLIFPFFAMAQSSAEKWYGGIGIGHFHYGTRWYYYRADGNPRHDNYPVHSINRLSVILSLRRQSLFIAGDFRFDADGELQLGIVGKTRANWLPGDAAISGGGLAIGIGGYMKAVYTLPHSDGPAIGVFGGLGPQISLLHNNGKNVGEFASEPYYSYTDGWNEYLYLLNGVIGANIELSSFVLTPELRFGITGFSSTSWEPNERGVTMDSSPTLLAFSVKLSKSF
jgi:hypothetical protein